MSQPTFPLIVAEGLDVIYFRSISAAERRLEVIDVEDNIYRGYDADGRLLDISVARSARGVFTRENHVRVRLAEELPTHAPQLKALLRDFLLTIPSAGGDPEGISPEGLALPDLIRRTAQYVVSE